jgi:hypothetical protein
MCGWASGTTIVFPERCAHETLKHLQALMPFSYLGIMQECWSWTAHGSHSSTTKTDSSWGSSGGQRTPIAWQFGRPFTINPHKLRPIFAHF